MRKPTLCFWVVLVYFVVQMVCPHTALAGIYGSDFFSNIIADAGKYVSGFINGNSGKDSSATVLSSNNNQVSIQVSPETLNGFGESVQNALLWAGNLGSEISQGFSQLIAAEQTAAPALSPLLASSIPIIGLTNPLLGEAAGLKTGSPQATKEGNGVGGLLVGFYDKYAVSTFAGVVDWAVANTYPGREISRALSDDHAPTQVQISWADPVNAKYESQLNLFSLPKDLPRLSLQQQANHIEDTADIAAGRIETWGCLPIVSVNGNTYTHWVTTSKRDGGWGVERELLGANVWQLEYDPQGKLEEVKISVKGYDQKKGSYFPIAEITTHRAAQP
jgi:hypothetical protein